MNPTPINLSPTAWNAWVEITKHTAGEFSDVQSLIESIGLVIAQKAKHKGSVPEAINLILDTVKGPTIVASGNGSKAAGGNITELYQIKFPAENAIEGIQHFLNQAKNAPIPPSGLMKKVMADTARIERLSKRGKTPR